MKTLALSVVVLLTACSPGQAAQEQSFAETAEQLAKTPPKVALLGRVSDHAKILDTGREADLTDRLEKLERRTGRQLVIVTVNSLDGQDVAVFTTDLANAWGVGRADHDDGVVLLVAPNEKRARIAVGYGLEKVLPDARCKQIMEQNILPRFRQDDLPGGIDAGAHALMGFLK